MALIDEIPEPTEHQLSTYTRLWDAGTHPWRRVWRDGVDRTDQDSSSWPGLACGDCLTLTRAFVTAAGPNEVSLEMGTSAADRATLTPPPGR